MRHQAEMLKGTDWNVLIVLDACRADAFARRVPGAATVRSLGRCTRVWAPGLAEVTGRAPTLYATANPVLNRELQWKRSLGNFRWLNLWRHCWAPTGPHALPTVPPEAVNRAVLGWVERHGQPRRLIVHYVQPHLPYVGRDGLPYADWGNCRRSEVARRLRRLKHPREAVAAGEIGLERVRAAYAGNLDLVLPHAFELAHRLAGTAVITADHGELLGEECDGEPRFGHVAAPCPELMEVPWLEVPGPEFVPARLPEAVDLAEEDETVRDRLEALGYA
ncbi:MAG: hypothetical protein ACOC7T_01235 [Planctomycetota bacterium]